MFPSCAAGMSTTRRPMGATGARRRAGTAMVSTGRPIPGNSGTGVQTPSGAGDDAGRVCAATATAAAMIATTMSVSRRAVSARSRMGSEATARHTTRQLDAASAPDANYAMTPSAAPTAADAERLAARATQLERERKHLLAVIEILKAVSTSLHFIDILHALARKLDQTLGLDRCSI